MNENNTVQVTSIEEYQDRMQKGLNNFLDYAEGEVVKNNETDYNNRSLTLTIVSEDEEPSEVVETDVIESSFEDCNGEFEFVVIGDTHFRFTVHDEPCWEEIEMSEHIGEAVGFIIESKD